MRFPNIAVELQIDFQIRRGDDEDGKRNGREIVRPVRPVFNVRTVAKIPWQWPSVLMGGGCDDDGVVFLWFVQRDFVDAGDEIQEVALRMRIDIRVALIRAVTAASLLRLADLMDGYGDQGACANDSAPWFFICQKGGEACGGEDEDGLPDVQDAPRRLVGDGGIDDQLDDGVDGEKLQRQTFFQWIFRKEGNDGSDDGGGNERPFGPDWAGGGFMPYQPFDEIGPWLRKILL